jgi:hypothetical protein
LIREQFSAGDRAAIGPAEEEEEEEDMGYLGRKETLVPGKE